MNTSLFSLQVKGARTSKDGKEYLVAPCVMLVTPGVYNGEYVPPNELQTFVSAWNDAPVVIRHPRDAQGEPTSAKGIDIPRVGRVYNVSLDGGKLKGDLWLDIEAVKANGATDTISAIENGDMVEVSTGYFRIFDPSAGVFNDQSYYGISRTIVPDHLALLPDQRGACSIEGGCGVPRVNTAPHPILGVDSTADAAATANTGGYIRINAVNTNAIAQDELDMLRRIDLVQGAWWSGEQDGWPLFIYDTYVVASTSAEQGIARIPYDIVPNADGSYSITFGEPVTVRVSFDTISPTATPQENIMRESIIQLLHARTGAEMSELEAKDDAALLDALLASSQAAPVVNEQTPCAELQAQINAFGGVQQVINVLSAVAQEAADKRTALVTQAQSQTGLDVSELQALSDSALQKLATPRSYVGQGTGIQFDGASVEYRTI